MHNFKFLNMFYISPNTDYTNTIVLQGSYQLITEGMFWHIFEQYKFMHVILNIIHNLDKQ